MLCSTQSSRCCLQLCAPEPTPPNRYVKPLFRCGILALVVFSLALAPRAHSQNETQNPTSDPAAARRALKSKHKAASAAPLSAEASSNPGEPCPGTRRVTGDAAFHHYRVRTYRGPNPAGCVEILRDNKRIFSETGVIFQIGGSPNYADDPNALIRVGTDVTGDGKPNLILGHWTGEAGCCYRLEVFEVGSDFRQVAGIDVQHSADAEFADVDGDGRLELIAEDWTFAEWHAASPATSPATPAPQVILRFRDGAFHLAADVMHKPAPPDSTLWARAQQVLASPAWKNSGALPASLWGGMLDLIYSGNAAAAWNFCEASWPPGRAGKEDFLKEFRSQLSRSPYWMDLKTLQSDSSLENPPPRDASANSQSRTPPLHVELFLTHALHFAISALDNPQRSATLHKSSGGFIGSVLSGKSFAARLWTPRERVRHRNSKT